MLLELKNIKKSFGQKKVLNEINFSLNGNGLYLIDGVNGAGKTTLLKIIGLLDSDYEGEYSFLGYKTKELKENALAGLRKKYISFFFQGGNDLSFLNEKENARFRSIVEGQEEVEEKESPSQGERTIDYLRKALLSKKVLLLLDEPTSNLSLNNAQRVFDTLIEVAKTKCVIVVTHDSLLLRSKKGIVIKLADGKLNYEEKGDGFVAKPSLPHKRKGMRLYLARKNAFRDPFSLLASLLSTVVFLFFGSGVAGLYSLNPEPQLCSFYKTGDQCELIGSTCNYIVSSDGGTYSLNSPYSFLTRSQFDDVERSGYSFTFSTSNADYRVLSSSEVCLVPKNYRLATYSDDTILIDGRYLPFKIDDSITKPVVNYRLYKSYRIEGRIDAYGAYFSSQIDSIPLQKTLNDEFVYHFVSPSTLKRRGETKELSVLDDEFYLGKNIASKASGVRCYFLDCSSFDFGPNWSFFPNYCSVFPNGVMPKYNQNLSTKLADNEILVSDDSLQKIGKMPRFSSASLTLNNIQEEIPFALKEGIRMRINGPRVNVEQIKEEARIWESLESATENARLWIPLLVVSFLFSLMEKSLVFLKQRRRPRDDFSLLRSLGHSSFDAALILYSPVFVGEAFGLIIGAAISPYSIYMMNNGTLMDVGALILLPFVVSIVMGLVFFLVYYCFQVKTKK